MGEFSSSVDLLWPIVEWIVVIIVTVADSSVWFDVIRSVAAGSGFTG